jgi:HK97 gp10 family phage protein
MALTWNNSVLRGKARKAAMRAVVRGTEIVREEAISLILNSQHSGRTYQRRGVVHQASAPGEPPASDTGRLVNSISAVYDTNAISGKVVVGAKHGLYLEFGTQTIEPRPFLRPAVANTKAKVQAAMAEEMKKL